MKAYLLFDTVGKSCGGFGAVVLFLRASIYWFFSTGFSAV